MKPRPILDQGIRDQHPQIVVSPCIEAGLGQSCLMSSMVAAVTEHLCLLVHTLTSLVLGPHSLLSRWFFFQGFRNLEDIRRLDSLTAQQVVGLKHYDDFLERMPREEAAEIEQTVSMAPRALRRARLNSQLGSPTGRSS